jgi:hypothetical protein
MVDLEDRAVAVLLLAGRGEFLAAMLLAKDIQVGGQLTVQFGIPILEVAVAPAALEEMHLKDCMMLSLQIMVVLEELVYLQIFLELLLIMLEVAVVPPEMIMARPLDMV